MKTEDLIEEIERNRRLSEFESTPRTAHDYCSAMPDKEMINRYIEYLISQSESKDLQNRSLQLKIDELTEKITSLLEEKQKESNRMEELITELRTMNAELSKSRKKIAKLEEQLKAAKADRYRRNRNKSNDDDDNADISSPDKGHSGVHAGTCL